MMGRHPGHAALTSGHAIRGKLFASGGQAPPDPLVKPTGLP